MVRLSLILICLTASLIVPALAGEADGGPRPPEAGANGGGRGGGRGNAMGGFMGRGAGMMNFGGGPGDFDRLAASSDPVDQDEAALVARQGAVQARLEALRNQAVEAPAVATALTAADEALAAYLAALEAIPEVKAMKEARANLRANPGGQREAFRQMGDLAQAAETAVAGNAALTDLRQKRTTAQTAFLAALRAALDGNAEYKALRLRAESLDEGLRVLREERMSAMRQQQRNVAPPPPADGATRDPAAGDGAGRGARGF